MVEENLKKPIISSWFPYSSNCFPIHSSLFKSSPSLPSSSTKNMTALEPSSIMATKSNQTQRKHGGWKTMPYILGNETLEKLGTYGLQANLMVYLTTQLHMNQVFATKIINIWSGTSGFAPLLGAFICDAYLGKFRTLACASVASFLGMVLLTFTAAFPALHPPACPKQPDLKTPCMAPSGVQVGFLFMAMGFMTIGAAGIRPASLPFGLDQFDSTTEEGKKGMNSFFNWYYYTFTVAITISITVVVFIQTNISWAFGFAIPTAFMAFSIFIFFLGTRLYIYVQPEGSVFSSIIQVFVAAFKKRHLELPTKQDLPRVLYDPPLKETTRISKLPLTHQFRCLNRAGIVVEGEVNPNGSCSRPWNLCSIQQIEEAKCLIRIAPICASNIICFLSIAQIGTFMVMQAMKMERHLGPKFEIPAGSVVILSTLTLAVWVPIYDRIIVPSIRRITKHQEGITLLQRIGIGMLFSFLSMVVAGIVENKRRTTALEHGQAISVFWLAPQLILLGFCEAFNIIGQIEFYYKQFPEHMKSIGNSLVSCTFACASYLNSLILVILRQRTKKHGHDWFNNDINHGRIDYFYFLIATLGVFNFFYFLICANGYHYKSSSIEGEEEA